MADSGGLSLFYECGTSHFVAEQTLFRVSKLTFNLRMKTSFFFLSSVGSVLLRDVQVLTLYKGRYTTARRSRPVSQLQCVGGSAGCHSFTPEVVQCQNKGWDGVDVQVKIIFSNNH